MIQKPVLGTVVIFRLIHLNASIEVSLCEVIDPISTPLHKVIPSTPATRSPNVKSSIPLRSSFTRFFHQCQHRDLPM